MLLPALNPAEVWQESGRWDVMGDNMFRLKDRFGRDLCLGMTHEEVMTAIARGELRSYKQLPQIWYQIQTKFRDEPRPKSGLLRVRQFIMKDSYYLRYGRGGTGCRLRASTTRPIAGSSTAAACDYMVVEAHSGAMGGSQSHEFMVASDAGEDFVVMCCQAAATRPIWRRPCRAVPRRARPIPMAISTPEEFHTPGRKTIAEVARVHGPAGDFADEEPGAGGGRQACAGACCAATIN